jgi:hypothetical protein
VKQKHPVDQRWTMRQRDWGVVLWIAFLTASVGEVLMFALVDPMDLVNAWTTRFDIGSRLAYSLGFAFLYLLSLLASWLTMFMIRTGPRRGHSSGQGARPKPNLRDSDHIVSDLKDRQ